MKHPVTLPLFFAAVLSAGTVFAQMPASSPSPSSSFAPSAGPVTPGSPEMPAAPGAVPEQPAPAPAAPSPAEATPVVLQAPIDVHEGTGTTMEQLPAGGTKTTSSERGADRVPASGASKPRAAVARKETIVASR